MNFWIVLMVGLLEGLIAHPLVHGNGWGKKGDIVIAISGAFVATLLYSFLGFPTQNDWGVIATSMIGATAALLHFVFIFSETPDAPKRRVP